MTEKQRSEAIKTRDVMESLTSSEGWKMFDAVLDEKEQHMMGAILDPGQDISDITLREYRMSLTTIRTIRGIPAAMVEDASEVITQLSDGKDVPEQEEAFEYG